MTNKAKLNLSDVVESFYRVTRHHLRNLPMYSIIPASVEAITTICRCKGKLITTGLGKAGHAAQKVASSFSSLGVPSCYLHPAQASHGDVGVVSKGDILLVFSTSGKTREVIETVELARKLNVSKVISITSHPESPLMHMSDLVISIGLVPEAGHLGLAPTTSILAMLMAADAIATGCALVKGLTREGYGLRHHGGYLGAKCRGEEP
jgi:arabinose-5-phosphate isomerase